MEGEQPDEKDKKELELNVTVLKKGELIIRAVDHPLRQKLLKLIHQHERITVTEIYKKLRLKQTDTSLHLAILRQAGMVMDNKEGQKIYYSINYHRMAEVQHKVKKLPIVQDKRRHRSITHKQKSPPEV